MVLGGLLSNPIGLLAVGAVALVAILAAIGFLWGLFSPGGSGGGGGKSNDPRIKVTPPSNPRVGKNADLAVKVVETDHPIDTVELEFNGSSVSIPDSDGVHKVTVSVEATNTYKAKVTDDKGNTGKDAGNFSGNTPGDPSLDLDVSISGDPTEPVDASNVQVKFRARADSGSTLSQAKIAFDGPSRTSTDSVSLTGSSETRRFTLDSSGLYSGDLSAGDYPVTVKVKSSSGDTEKTADVDVHPDTPPGPPPGPSGPSGGGDIDNDNIMKVLMNGGGAGGGGSDGASVGDIDLSNSQEQSAMQNLSMMQQMFQQQMQMQQMQQMMNPAVMQFANLIQGNVNVGNGAVVIPGGGQQVQVNQQLLQQLLMAFIQADIDENEFLSIITPLLLQGGNGLNQALIQQVINIIQKEEGGDINIEVEVEKEINVQQIQDIEQVFVKQVENNYDLTQEQYNFAIQIADFFNALINQQFNIEGNDVIINLKDGGRLEIHYSTLIEFIKLVNNLPSSTHEKVVNAIINQLIIQQQVLQLSEDVIREIIMILKEGGEVSGGSRGADITIEELSLTQKPQPGMTTDQIGLKVRASCNKSNGLQQAIFKFDDRQKAVGLNNTSYQETVNIADIIGENQFQAGQTHNYGITLIGQQGNRENRINQVEVGNGSELPEGSDSGKVPGLPDESGKLPLEEGLEETEEEEKELKELLEDLKKASKAYKQLQSDLEEIEKLHQQMSDGTSIDQLTDKQKKLLRGDAQDIKELLQGMMDLYERVEQRIKRIKEHQEFSEQDLKQFEKEKEKMKGRIAEVEDYITQIQQMQQGELGAGR